VKKVTQDAAWTPFVSNSGKALPHGLGWFVENYRGTKLIWHFGDFPNSFSALLLKVPEKKLSLYVLANSDALSEPPFFNNAGVEGSPFASTFLRLFVFEELLGRSLPDPRWSDTFAQFSGRMALYKKQVSDYQYDAETIGYDAMAKWILERHSQARKSIKVDPKIYDSYVGQYGGRPDGTGGFLVTAEGGRLLVDVPKNGKFEMFPESDTRFFLKGMDLQMSFIKDEKAQVTHMEFQLGDQKGRPKKVK
jgi:hypothetical protein